MELHARPSDMERRPIFHIASPSGWLNDPNGPLFWRGRYHLFFQHLKASVKWSWGLVWGHVSSADLVHWERHPPALCPTPNGPDAAGCFSGCAAVVPGPPPAAAAAGTSHAQQQQPGAAPGSSIAASYDGVPMLLYTGVMMRPDVPAGLLPGSLTVSELCYEQQLAAVAENPGDPALINWTKQSAPVLQHTPPGACLNCFRDPFILEQPCAANHHTWRVMLGAGMRDQGTGLTCAGPPPEQVPPSLEASAGASTPAGAAVAAAAGGEPAPSGKVPQPALLAPAAAAAPALQATGVQVPSNSEATGDSRRAARGTALVYSTKDLLAGWQFQGFLCTANTPETEGCVWECPILADLPLQGNAVGQLSKMPGTQDRSHLFSVSVGTFPSIYWLGCYANDRFDLAAADGPYPLDAGDVLYAPNLLQDGKGRLLMWAWLRELRGAASTAAKYAGCLSLPRQLLLGADGHLHQLPLPELQQLCTQPAWKQDIPPMVLQPGVTRHVAEQVPTSHFCLNLTWTPGNPAQHTVAGFMLPASSSLQQSPLTSGQAAADNSSSGGHSSQPGYSASATLMGEGVVLLYDFSLCQLQVSVGSGVGQDVVGAWSSDSSNEQVASSTVAMAPYMPGSSSAGSHGDIRRLGCKLRLSPGSPVQLTVFMDHSVLEVFAGDGQVLTTRVCRATACGEGAWPVAAKGTVCVSGGSMSAMSSIWL